MKVKDTINLSIKQQGYITIDRFMKLALSECNDSYYRNKDPIGPEADFITAPEISQMFGEIIAIWVVDKWIKMGSPQKINLVELGPGKGSLMRDLLNITKYIEGFHDSITIYMVEVNEKLMEVQQKILKQHEHININWVSNILDIPKNHTIIIGNEFFDSLPIKQFIYNNSWRERVIVLSQDGVLKFSEIDIINSQILDYLSIYKSVQNGSIIEYSEESEIYINLIKKIINQNLSYSLFIDYGYYIDPKTRNKNQYNSTIQALYKHKFVDIFYDIGNADITSHVDFHRLSIFAKNTGFKVTKNIISQGDFLKTYGIENRLKVLSSNKSADIQTKLQMQYKRLVNPEQMGDLFKVIELYTD